MFGNHWLNPYAKVTAHVLDNCPNDDWLLLPEKPV